MNRGTIALTLLACSTLALAGCSKTEPDDAPSGTAAASEAAVEPGDEALGAVLTDADGLQTTAEALKETGLDGIFGHKASYTVLAPTDDAFGKLGDAGKQLIGSGNTAALAALLKAHILPGYLSAADISAAVDRNGGKAVKMRTMAGSDVTFTKQGDALTVSAPGGVSATLSGDAVAGKGSIALPIDTVLKPA